MIKARHALLLGFTLLLSGCKMALLNPKGMIAASEKHLFIDAILLMLIVVIPVIILSFVFAWKYSAKNQNANYTPDWSHSTAIEAVCWIIPCVIIGILAVMTWISSHKLDPYRPLDVKGKPIIIEAIALDWKWLFIYPKQHIATVNFVQFPAHVPIRFLITADAPMNSLEIPQLAGQIYAMAGMRTKLNLIADEPGIYDGFSANYSGNGFSDMKFTVKASSRERFDKWVRKVKRSKHRLTMSTYDRLARPSENDKVHYFSHSEKQLFHKVIEKYLKPSNTESHKS
jgi:cytochrome o ubiquinol oxidase subunit II